MIRARSINATLSPYPRSLTVSHVQSHISLRNASFGAKRPATGGKLRIQRKPSTLSLLKRSEKRQEEKKEETEKDEEEFTRTPGMIPRDERTNYLINPKGGNVNIPESLEHTIQRTVNAITKESLQLAAIRLSESLRARTTTKGSITTMRVHNKGASPSSARTMVVAKEAIEPISYTREKALAYAAHRMPGVYGCTYRVFNEVKAFLPDFQPKTMLDFGSGPGTAIWSAREVFSEDCIKKVVAIEPSSGMLDLAESTTVPLTKENKIEIEWKRFLFKGDKGFAKHDLVVASYVMSEMKDNKERRDAVKNLWDSTEPGGVLVIMEPGTPIGFDIIRDIRDFLLTRREINTWPNIILPVRTVLTPQCTHSSSVPTRVERISLSKGIKLGATQNYEDEKFSYLVVKKCYGAKTEEEVDAKHTLNHPEPGMKWSKIVRPPIKKGGHILVDLCTPTGKLNREIVSKSLSNDIFLNARHARWGDHLYLRPKSERMAKRDNDLYLTRLDTLMGQYQERTGRVPTEEKIDKMREKIEEEFWKIREEVMAENEKLKEGTPRKAEIKTIKKMRKMIERETMDEDDEDLQEILSDRDLIALQTKRNLHQRSGDMEAPMMRKKSVKLQTGRNKVPFKKGDVQKK
ncbi:hypothetical protein PROFUN_05900 [Planoprotostelium fungivorum]|uniref:Uncharacterized protein n=1 Tax=Planoprotostelium fungivorum TaxID=1890364 RepID=A0A2P6NKR0_9EUKA|nr:hypothetical protein PROFUN_05900 [Planoprotostelium fungivorum]